MSRVASARPVLTRARRCADAPVMKFTAARRKLGRMIFPRRLSPEDFRRIAHETANDPEVDRAVREAVERYPHYRRATQRRDV